MISIPLIGLAAGVLAIAVRLIQKIRLAYFTPLRKIPGPWYAPLTNWGLKRSVLGARRCHYIHEMHQKYGPIVRLSPDEIAIADASAFKEIHRIGGGFNKSVFYDHLSTGGTGRSGCFNMTNPREHAARRKLLARGFGQRYLRETWEHTVHDMISLAVAKIKEDAKGTGKADVLKWWTFMATDVSAQLMFGESFYTLESGVKSPYIIALQTTNKGAAIEWEMPYIHALGRLIPNKAMKALFHAHDEILAYGVKAVANSRAQGLSTTNIFATVLAEADKSDATLTDEQVQVEAGNLIVAGSDTTAISQTFLTWAVLSQPALQRALEDEVAAVEAPLTDAALERLPILNAVIEESLRLYGAVPGTLPRVVPKGGAELGGYYIPEGVTVGAQCWSMHRDAALFPEPESAGGQDSADLRRFDHTRWMPPNKLSDAAGAAYAPFGAGSRICLGIHLARMELRLATAIFFRECKGARLAPGTTAEMMEVENYFLIAPKSHRCEIAL